MTNPNRKTHANLFLLAAELDSQAAAERVQAIENGQRPPPSTPKALQEMQADDWPMAEQVAFPDRLGINAQYISAVHKLYQRAHKLAEYGQILCFIAEQTDPSLKGKPIGSTVVFHGPANVDAEGNHVDGPLLNNSDAKRPGEPGHSDVIDGDRMESSPEATVALGAFFQEVAGNELSNQPEEYGVAVANATAEYHDAQRKRKGPFKITNYDDPAHQVYTAQPTSKPGGLHFAGTESYPDEFKRKIGMPITPTDHT